MTLTVKPHISVMSIKYNTTIIITVVIIIIIHTLLFPPFFFSVVLKLCSINKHIGINYYISGIVTSPFLSLYFFFLKLKNTFLQCYKNNFLLSFFNDFTVIYSLSF